MGGEGGAAVPSLPWTAVFAISLRQLMREGWSLLAYLPSDLVNRGRRVGGGRGRIQSNIRFTVLMRVAAVHYDVK